MKNLSFILTGVLFGIIMTKGELISWFRIHEMFRFESFHMYGVIGSAVGLGALMVFLLKKTGMTSVDNKNLKFSVKSAGLWHYLLGGTIFGLGWAMTGACPGPLYVLLGNGFSVFIVVIGSALFGAFTYGMMRNYLPH